MKTLKFPYVRYLVSRPRAKKPEYVYRPVVPVMLSFGKEAVRFDALIDSGADECTFPAWIATRLGKDLFCGRQKIFSGIGGSVPAYLHKSKLQVGEVDILANVYYSHDWDDMPFGLLGQAGFFSGFDVRFSHKEKVVHLRQE